MSLFYRITQRGEKACPGWGLSCNHPSKDSHREEDGCQHGYNEYHSSLIEPKTCWQG